MSDDLPQGQIVQPSPNSTPSQTATGDTSTAGVQPLSQRQNSGAVQAAPVPTQIAEPEQPIGTPHKEQGPLVATIEPTPPATPEIVLPPEARETGTEATEEQGEQSVSSAQPEEPTKPEERQETEQAAAQPAVPAGQTLPFSYAEAVEIEKQASFDDSKHWFARLIEFLWKRTDPTIDKKKK